ncbi:hypothetical protein ES707_14704 [subsurface metagenome]
MKPVSPAGITPSRNLNKENICCLLLWGGREPLRPAAKVDAATLSRLIIPIYPKAAATFLAYSIFSPEDMEALASISKCMVKSSSVINCFIKSLSRRL